MPTRKPFLVLGAGLMGKAIAFDLVRSSPHCSITLAAIDLDVLTVNPRGEIESLSFPAPFENLEVFQPEEAPRGFRNCWKKKCNRSNTRQFGIKAIVKKLKPLFDVGFADNEPLSMGSNLVTTRELFLELLKKRLTFNEPDAVLLLVSAIGSENGRDKRFHTGLSTCGTKKIR
jgi:saccharopine dehydrogenase-like NADP-dependent oxidoreductase